LLKAAEGAALGQFHVTIYVTNLRFAHLAAEAMLDRTLIAMSSDIGEDADPVIGFIQSIEEDAGAVASAMAHNDSGR
jgi:hypothetical protein